MARSAKTKTPRLSFETVQAIEDATEPFFGIELIVERLEEEDLVGFAAEARRRAGESLRKELHLALAAMADARLAIFVARRSPHGIWYANLDVVEWEPSMHVGKSIASYSEKCEGRAAAVIAARRLLVDHVDEFAEEISVDARICTELEWASDRQG
jgi:hypothetical protein